jgi:hypothetical protein
MSNVKRQVPEEDDDEFRLFLGVTLKDLIILAPAAIFFYLGLVVPPILTLQMLTLSIIWVILALVALGTTPRHYDSTRSWVALNIRNVLDSNDVGHVEEYPKNMNRDHKDTGDYSFTKQAIDGNTRTQEYLKIARIHPSSPSDRQYGAVELTNGTLINAVRVYPTDLTLGTPQEWRAAVEDLTSAINMPDYRIEIARTTSEFDTEQFLEPYEQRRRDEDMRDSKHLGDLHEHFLEWYPEQLEKQRTRIAEYYVVVGVAPREVERTARTKGFSGRLAELPVFSRFMSSEETPDSVLRGRQRKELFNRLEAMEGKVAEISKVETEIIYAEDNAELISEAWKRKDLNVNLKQQISATGVVTRK